MNNKEHFSAEPSHFKTNKKPFSSLSLNEIFMSFVRFVSEQWTILHTADFISSDNKFLKTGEIYWDGRSIIV